MMRRLSVLLLTVFLFIPTVLYADIEVRSGTPGAEVCDGKTGLAAAACRSTKTAGSAGFNVGVTSLTTVLGLLIQSLLGLLGVVFLILMIYGGYTWMTARENEEQAKKAKSTITNAAIGLIVVLASYVIYAFIGGILGIA